MPTITLQGKPIYYAARGERGAPVVFVHGAGSNHLIWNSQLAALSGLAHAYALDLPGHGRSGGMGRRTIRGYADVVCAFMDALGIHSAVIAGHSMGGAVAQTLGLENSERVAGLVLVGTGARLRVLPAFLEGAVSDFANTARKFSDAEFAAAADLRLKELSEQQLSMCDPKVFEGDLVACNTFDLIPLVQEIRVPALVICGKEDWMTPVKYSQFLAGRMPSAQIRIVEGAGHLVMVEKPDEVSHALLEWIPSLGAGSE